LLAFIVVGGDDGGVGSVPVDADVAFGASGPAGVNCRTETSCWTGAGGGTMLDGVHDVSADCGTFPLAAVESFVTFACMNREDERKEHLKASVSTSKGVLPKIS
jgi:hypothetical protein